MLRGLYRLKWREPTTSRDADAGFPMGSAGLRVGREPYDCAARIGRKVGERPQAVLPAALRFAEANPDSFARFVRQARIAGHGRTDQHERAASEHEDAAEKTVQPRSFRPRLSFPMSVEIFTSLLFLVGVAVSAILILAGQ